MKKAIDIQQENANALFELIKNNPELPIIPMVTSEVIGDDNYQYWMGSWGKAEIDSYSCHDEIMVYLSDGVDDIFSTVFDDIVPDDITEEEENEFIHDAVMGMEWTKAIIVRIETPN